MPMPRDEWIVFWTRLQADWRAYSQEFTECERGPNACVVDDFLRSLVQEWAKRGRRAW